MNILFTVCGRAGSKGVKNKNMRQFLDEPLIFYTFSAISLYRKEHPEHYCNIVLNTDSRELMELVKCKVEISVEQIERDKDLSGEHTPKISVIQDCLNKMQLRGSQKYDLIVDLDITSPLRKLKDIDSLIKEYEKGKYDVVFSITDSRRNPYFNMVKREGDYFDKVIHSSYTARQQAPELFDMNASMYAYSPVYLGTGKGIFEGRCGAVKMYDTGILDIDCENDFELMQVIAKYLYRSDREFAQIKEHISNIIL